MGHRQARVVHQVRERCGRELGVRDPLDGAGHATVDLPLEQRVHLLEVRTGPRHRRGLGPAAGPCRTGRRPARARPRSRTSPCRGQEVRTDLVRQRADRGRPDDAVAGLTRQLEVLRDAGSVLLVQQGRRRRRRELLGEAGEVSGDVVGHVDQARAGWRGSSTAAGPSPRRRRDLFVDRDGPADGLDLALLNALAIEMLYGSLLVMIAAVLATASSRPTIHASISGRSPCRTRSRSGSPGRCS